MAGKSLGLLTIDLVAKIGGFESGMDRAARTADRKGREISSSARKRAKETEEAWSKVGSVIGSVFASIAVGAVFQKFARETMNAEKEQAQLAAVLQSTGNAAGYSAGRLNEMAGVMESSLGIAAGEVNKAQTVLLAFTNIVGDQLPKALQAAADHAARTGSTISASAEIMGRALDVPSVGMASLQKQGFKFSESQIELARELERTGKVAQAQQMVLDSLNESYGGAAAAARDTFGGALGALQNTINSLLTGDTGSMKQMKKSVEDMNATLSSEQTRAAFQTLISWMVDLSTAVIRSTANLVAFINTKNKLSVIMGTDDFGKMKANADGYSHQLTELVSKAERFQEALSRNPDDKNMQRMLNNVRAKITEVQAKVSGASQDLKDFASLQAPSGSSALAIGPDLKPINPGAVNLKDGAKGGSKSAGKSGKTEAEKEADAAEKFLKSLREQSFKIQEKTAYEKLFFDLQEKGLSLSGKQMDQAIGLVTAIDMAKESERTKAAEIERQNSLYEVQGALMSRQQQYALELATAGMGSKAAAEMRERISLLQEYQQKLAQMRQDQAMAIAGAGSDREVDRINAQFQVRIELTKKALDTELEMFDAHSKRKQMIEFDWSMGASAALNNYLEEASNVYAQTESMATNAFKGMEDALVSFATTGKLNFNDLAKSIIADLARIQAKAAISGIMKFIGPAVSAHMGDAMGMSIGGTYGPQTQAGLDSLINGLQKNALGGVYDSPSLSAYSNQVHSSPKMFAFAKGAGVFGEAGPEAIMPLTRAANGSLGVRAVGGDGGVKVEIINQGAPAKATATQERQPDGSSLIRIVLQAVAEDMSSGGMTARATAGRFGLATQ